MSFCDDGKSGRLMLLVVVEEQRQGLSNSVLLVRRGLSEEGGGISYTYHLVLTGVLAGPG